MIVSNLQQDPTFTRIKSLNEKWANIHHEIDRKKEIRNDYATDAISSLEDQISQSLALEDNKIKDLQVHTHKLQQLVDQEKQRKIVFQADKKKQIQSFENQLIERMMVQKKIMETTSDDLVKVADQKILNSLEKIQEFNLRKYDTIEVVLSKARQKLIGLQGRIVEERKRREQQTTQMTQMIEGELNILHNALGIQKKIRQQTQGKIFKMIQEIHNKLQQELTAQRLQREQTNVALMNLLDETCLRMDTNFR